MKCVDCEGCCSCHISPPCGYCVDHAECEVCGNLTCNESDENGKLYCFGCWEEVAE